MFVYAIYNREGSPETTEKNKFDDVAKGSYYENAVAWALANNIVAGYDDKHYAPNESISREQMAAILWRYAKFKNYDVSVSEDMNVLNFKDAEQISAYAAPAIRWAVKDGIITGFEDNTMRPKENANRAQMAVIFNKISNLIN
ncbi:MAG: S-layer homology domain-containing protein [Firmicutes bacterium]|nr:S-layer homology domain-containing protein [Bacillota bacterium]